MKSVSLQEYLRTAPSDSVDVGGMLYTNKHFKNPHLEVGDYTYGVPNLRYTRAESKLVIGKFCAIAANVIFYLGGNHNTDTLSTYPFPLMPTDYPKAAACPYAHSKGNITVGNDVWFGDNVTVLSGVTIGDGAVIGLGSIVTKDVPPYAIVAGNPARVVKMRFPDEEIAELLRIKWWDWPIERIRDNAHLIAGKDARALLAVA